MNEDDRPELNEPNRFPEADEARVVTLGLVGADRRITPLLSRMLEYDYVDVRLVVDESSTAPGVLIAQSLGVATSHDPQDLLAILPDLDLVFCLTEDGKLRETILAELRSSENRRTAIINERATRFVLSLAKDARELLPLST